MKQVQIVINTTNSAFDEHPNLVLADLLSDLATYLREDYHANLRHKQIRDVNGNTCGTLTILKEKSNGIRHLRN